MGEIFQSVGFYIFTALNAVLIGTVTFYKRAFTYWKKRNVPFARPVIPFGTMGNPLVELEALGVLMKRQYLEFKAKGYKHVGLYKLWMPVYMPIDPKYISNILFNDFHHFKHRGICYENKNDPSAANLYFVEGHKWRFLRDKLENIFTLDNTKKVFPILLKCVYQLKDAITEKQPVDIKNTMDLHVLDVIFTTIFGQNCNNIKNPNSDLARNVRHIFKSTLIERFRNLLFALNPNFAKKAGFRFIPKEPAEFFERIIRNTVESRKNAALIPGDFLQMMLDVENNFGHSKNKQMKGLSMEEITAQIFLFLVAGYETLTITLVFSIFELAVNPDIQESARKEVKEILKEHDGEIVFDALKEMRCLDQILYETMRKYPAVPILNRKCVLDYRIPETGVIIKKGTDVIIPVMGLHYDEEYFPDPEKFDPGRFSNKSDDKICLFKYMPFGEGPRICFAADFTMVEMKLVLAILLKDYSIQLNEKTKLPLKISPFNIVLNVLEDVWLDFKRLSS